MHRTGSFSTEHRAAMRVAGLGTFQLLLPAAAGERRESAADAAVGRVVSGASLLRQPADGHCSFQGMGPGSEPQTGAAMHAADGTGSFVSPTQPEPAGAGTRDFPVFTAWLGDPAMQSSLEQRHHLRSDARRILVSNGGVGLVQSLRAELGVVQYFGRLVLPVGAGSSFRLGQPEIFNTDQGAQFTAQEYLGLLKKREIRISMDGRGRALDNLLIERLWRSVKYELIYPGDFGSGEHLMSALRDYFWYYNYRRPHQGLGYATPSQRFGQQP